MENDKKEPRKPENPVVQPDPKNLPEPPPIPQPSANKSNPAADGDGKTEIDHHKKETEEQQPKADPFKRTDYHQPTPDQKFAAANKENMEKHAQVVNPEAAMQQEEQTAGQKIDSLSGTDKTTDQ
jgi:hypothetical protein